MKICAQCEHFADMQGSGQYPRCFRRRPRSTDPVTGRTIIPEESYVYYAKDVRADRDDCGPSGIYWSEKKKSRAPPNADRSGMEEKK